MYYGGDNNCMFVDGILVKHNKRMRSPDVRKKISETMKKFHSNHKVSDETKKKISNKLKQFYANGNKPNYKVPQHLTAEHKQALLESKYKQIQAEFLDGTVKVFHSLKDAYKYMVDNFSYVNKYGTFARAIKKSFEENTAYKSIFWKYI